MKFIFLGSLPVRKKQFTLLLIHVDMEVMLSTQQTHTLQQLIFGKLLHSDNISQ